MRIAGSVRIFRYASACVQYIAFTDPARMQELLRLACGGRPMAHLQPLQARRRQKHLHAAGC